jgi:type VI secretion system protein ImpK
MQAFTGYESSTAQEATPGRRGRLALSLQDALTATVRLRTNQQVAADAASFRAQLKRLLGQADQDARGAGYSSESVKLAVYATIAFIDETVLNSAQPMFADWPRRPLQEEVFGEHMAGEVFFENVRALLARSDSEELADVLEVYLLCLLLGFQGRYGGGGGGELASVKTMLADRITRIRGVEGDLSPAWALPADEEVPRARDPWVRRLGFSALATAAVAFLLWLVYFLSLRSGTGDL